MECSIEGCIAVERSKGWCEKHYYRWYRHGDPLHAKRDALECSVCGGEARKPNKRRSGQPLLCQKCYRAQWRAANMEKERAAQRALYQRNLAKYRAKSIRSNRARKYPIPHYTKGSFVEAIRQRFKYWGDKCYLCGRDDVLMTADHVIAMSAGGSNLPANIRPACKPCNSSKHANDWREYVGGAL